MKKSTKKLLLGGGVIAAIYFIWKHLKEKSEDKSNIGGEIRSYNTKGGGKICYHVSPRGSIQEVPCPK